MTEERKITISTEVDATGAREGLNEVKRDAGAMAAAVAKSGAEATRALSDIGNGAGASATKVESAQRNLIGSIQRTTAALQAGSKSSSDYYETLARQRGVDPKVLAPYIEQLRAVEATQGRATAAVAGAAPAIKNLGTSAAQTAAALRGVPAQFTDIVTAIQGGQAPLTVLLQQGGQLKDMFGGAGAAARGLGGYIAGLINPFTIAAAAVGVLAIAYAQGSAETKAYNQALITSGNVAGTSAGKLTEMARSISATVGTQGAAAEALTALVQTGRVAANDLVQFGTTAISVQRALGQSVADTASEFADLSRTPVSALEKLNEKYHFLTASVYEQVRALQIQGREDDAAALAQRTYANALDDRAKQVVSSLGTVEKAWTGVKDWAKRGWDAILDVGRPTTDTNKIDSLSAGIAASRSRLQNLSKLGPGKDNQRAIASEQSRLNSQLVEQELLQATTRETNRANEAKASGVKLEEAKVKWQKEGEQYLSRAKQLEIEITAARNKGNEAGESQAAIDKRVGEIRKKYADIYNDAIDASIEKLQRQASLEEIRSKRAQEQIAFLRQIGDLSEKDALKSATEVEVAAIAKRKALLIEELDLIKQKANSKKDQAAKQAEIDALEEAGTARKVQGERELLLLAERRAQVSADLFNKGIASSGNELQGILDSVKSQREYNEEIGLTKVQSANLRAARIQGTAELKLETAAALEAIEPGSELAASYRDQAAALSERAQLLRDGAGREFQFEEWKKAVDTYGDVFRTGFADMLNNGKAGWTSFTRSLVTTFKTSVADQIYKMFAQPFVMKLVASLIGVGGSAAAGFAQASTSGESGTGVFGALSSAASLASMGKAIYAGFSSGFASAVGTGISTFGNLVGSQAISAFGTGASLTASQAATAASAYSAAGNTAVAGGLTSGASAGAYAIPIAGWIAAGMALSSSLYKQGWDVNNGTVSDPLKLGGGPMIFNNLLKGIGLSNSAANVFSGQATIARLFGRRNPTVEDAGIEGTLNSSGFSGNSYQNILEKGGVFRSDKRYTTTANLDAGAEGFLDGTIKNLIASVKGFGEGLGVESSQIDGYTKAIKVSLTSDDAKNQEIVTKLFGEIGDDLAKLLIPTIDQFSKSAEEFGGKAETASETLQRIATDYVTIDAALDSIGKSFGAVGLSSVSAREQLLSLTGGLEAFSKSTAYFAQNYLTEAERMEPVAKSVAAQFDALGLALPDTRDEFKALVLGLDLTTEKGAATYAGLMKVQEGFALLHPVINDAADAFQASADAIAAAATTARDAQREALQGIGNALAGALDRTVEAAKNLRAYSDSLLTGSLSALDAEERYQAAKKQFQAADPTDTNAATAYLQAAKERDAGDFSYGRDFQAVIEKAQLGAAILDERVTGIINFWRSFNQPTVIPTSIDTSPVITAQPQINQETIVKELREMKNTLVLALDPIATNTSATADVLDKVTSGGAAMVTEAA